MVIFIKSINVISNYNTHMSAEYFFSLYVRSTIFSKFWKKYYSYNNAFSVPMGVPGGKSGCMFTPIPVEVACYEPEVVGSKYRF